MTTEKPRRLPDLTDDSWRGLIAGCDNVGDDRVVHFTEYLEQKSSTTATTFFSNFPEFDSKLGGLQTGEVTVISGKTGEGKTTFAESWMNGMMQKSNARACVFSFEVSPANLLKKYESTPELPIYLPLQLETMNLKWLGERIVEARNKHMCRVVILDHLHFLVDMSTKQNMSLNIGAFMRKLKQEIAVGLDVAVLLIAHQKGTPRGEDPSLEDIRDSSFISQEADNVVICWRQPDLKENEMIDIRESNPSLYARIDSRCAGFRDLANSYSWNLESVQIAKARRSGTYRWKKLFQKVGSFFEEV